MRRRWNRYLLLGIAASVLLVVHATHYWTTWLDDAYITFRYSRNLWAGRGMVYNPAERVEGLTNLAWAVLLGPFTSGDVLLAAKVLGLAAALGIVATLTMWGRAARLSLAATATVLAIVVLVPWLPYWAVQGMETPVVTALVTLGWTRMAIESDRLARGTDPGWPLAAVALGLAPSFRPDAALPVLLLCGWFLLLGPPGRAAHTGRSALIVGALGLALLAAKLLWFGTLLPNTFRVKTAPWPWPNGRQYLASFLQVPWPPFALATLATMLWGLWRALRRDPWALPAIVVLAYLFVSLSTNGDYFPNFRILVPAIPAMAACLGLAFNRLGRVFGRRAVCVAWTLGMGAAMVGPQYRVFDLQWLDSFEHWPRTSAIEQSKHAPLLAPWRSPDLRHGFIEKSSFVTAWVVVHTTADELVAHTDIGLFGYAIDNPVADVLGLVTPRLALPRGSSRLLERSAAYQRAWMEENVDFILMDRSCDRWRIYGLDDNPTWRRVDGCGPTAVFANRRIARDASKAMRRGLFDRISRAIARTPGHISLHVAILRELAAAQADTDVISKTMALTRAGAPSSWSHALTGLACEVGLTGGCTPLRNTCGNMAQPRRWAEP